MHSQCIHLIKCARFYKILFSSLSFNMRVLTRACACTENFIIRFVSRGKRDITFRSLTFISNKKSATLSNNRKRLINTIHSEVFTAARLKRFLAERIYARVILPGYFILNSS